MATETQGKMGYLVLRMLLVKSPDFTSPPVWRDQLKNSNFKRCSREEMQPVPDKLRQDRVFAISPGLFLVPVSMLSRDTSVSVACRDEDERKEECRVGWWERRGHPSFMPTGCG